MGLLDSIKSVFGGGTGAAARETDRVYIVDAEKLADNQEGRTGPIERLRAIQQLGRFAEREKVEMVAVVGGRPLREVAHGESLNGVRVFYVEENSAMADQIEKTIGEARSRNPVVVTNDKQLEARLLERGIATLRVSSLRKALENGGDNGGERNDRGRGRRQRRNSRTDRPQRPAADNPAGASESGAAPDSSDRNNQPGDTVDGLIDRVN